MNTFVFLYPIQEIFDFEIEEGTFIHGNDFPEKYKRALNEAIKLRYGQKGYRISYATFDGKKISDIITLHPTDTVIEVGITFEDHTTKKEYPLPETILDRLGNPTTIRIAGFHMWDCVERLARRAYELGIDTLVDEDLTEFLTARIEDPQFRTNTYPTYTPNKKLLADFLEARRESPWLWQKYPTNI